MVFDLAFSLGFFELLHGIPGFVQNTDLLCIKIYDKNCGLFFRKELESSPKSFKSKQFLQRFLNSEKYFLSLVSAQLGLLRIWLIFGRNLKKKRN